MKELKGNLFIQVFMMCLFTLVFANANAQKGIPVKNHVFIIDVSGSMNADLGGETRLDKVKEVIKGYTHQITDGDYISIYSYNQRLMVEKRMQINSQADKNAFIDFVNKLKADGSTCTYKTLDQVLGKLDASQMNIIQLYTDGEDSGVKTCGNISLGDALGKYKAQRGEYDFLFYIAAYDNPNPQIASTVNSISDAQYIEGNSSSIPQMIIIIPQIIHMTYGLENFSINQGFYVIGKEFLPKDFKVMVDEPTLNIKGLTGNNEHPYFKQGNSLSPFSLEAMELGFTNPIDNLDEGTYKGTFKFKRKPDEAVHAYIIPNEIEIIFENKERSTVKWGVKRD